MCSAALSSTSGRPLRLQKRADLVVQRQDYLGRRYWVVKDPLALKYYRFEEEEFELLQMLDGRCSLEELQFRFETRFAPQKITLSELHQFVGMLHRSALVVSDAAGQGEQLLARRRQQSRSRLWSAAGNVLSIRIPLWDPDRFLGWLNRRLGWLLALPSVIVTLLLAVAALLLVTVQFDVFRQKLPGFHEFFATANWGWLAAALCLTKILHELGHGLACKRLGGQCQEMGILFLVFTPCLYCNVTDSWMLPNKWQRAAIAAAGIYVELALAAGCTFLWWFSTPGLLHYLCLNIMFVGSISTLLFNANPLLRYDGYYILADVLEMPNLNQKSRALLRRAVTSWILGVAPPPDPFLPQRHQLLLAIYAVAAAAYRWLITVSVLWFLHLVFRPHGLQIVGHVLMLVVLYGLLVQPAWQLRQFFRIPGRMDRVNKKRCALVCGAAGLAIAACWIPLPHYVRCSLYLEPGQATSVYAESPGHVRQIHVRHGDWVRKGQPLATLDNVDIRLELARLQSEKLQLVRRLEGLRQRAFDDEQAAQEMAELNEAIAAADEQSQKRQRDSDRLAIAAPVSGVVLPTPHVSPSPAFGQLPTWCGSPLDDHNLGAYLPEGVPICHVGDPRQFQAILAIDQTDLEFVRTGQPVEIVLAELPGRRYRSRLEQLSLLDMQTLPAGLSSRQGGDVLARPDPAGRERPLQTTFQGSAPLVDPDGLLWLGATGDGRIRVGNQTMARWVWRYLCHTFQFVA
jgi:putative peptide zinc metalloprotease protein